MTPLCCFISQRIVHKLIMYPVNHHSPALYICFAKTLWEAPGFSGHDPPHSLHGFAINLTLLQILMFQFFGPHCVSGTWWMSQKWADSLSKAGCREWRADTPSRGWTPGVAGSRLSAPAAGAGDGGLSVAHKGSFAKILSSMCAV